MRRLDAVLACAFSFCGVVAHTSSPKPGLRRKLEFWQPVVEMSGPFGWLSTMKPGGIRRASGGGM